MTITFNRFVLLLAALLPSLAAGAPSPQHGNALTEYVAAGKSLHAVLDSVKDVDTATAAKDSLFAAVVRYNAAKASLRNLKFEENNPEHQNLIQAATQDMATISLQVNNDVQRIRTLPQVQKLLASTLKQLM
jgi:hypothetical protein